MFEQEPELNQSSPAKARTLGDFLAQLDYRLSPEDVIHSMASLMRQVAVLHDQGRVGDLTLSSVHESDDGRFLLSKPDGLATRRNLAAIDKVQPKSSSALKIIGEYRLTSDEESGSLFEDLSAAGEETVAITKPVYLPGLGSWEIELGHHDEITDVFVIGMIMASIACGLDFTDRHHVERFASNRSNLFAIAPNLHPVLATIILEATALNRHDRATNLHDLVRRLETYRDQPVGLDVERVLASNQGTANRRNAVLAHLRDRLFDLSRRNKLIHFRNTLSSVNLTEASVPIVLRVESVRSDQLCTWKGKFVDDVLSGKAVPLNQWLRFEDQNQLPSSFDRLIQETRRDRAEYGFSHLRLAVAFLHWNNLKDAPNERITSPLLWLPVEVSKVKGVRDQYVMRCNDTIAEFNPALRHMLRQLYDIRLPDEIDLRQVKLTDVHSDLMAQIHKSEPGVRLAFQDRPQIQLIHQKAVQRVNRYNRRRNISRNSANTRLDFNYARDDYRPLGHALFEKFVRPAFLPQRGAAGGATSPKTTYAVAQVESLGWAKGGDEGHKFAWELDLTQVTIANLNYKKMSLVRDYEELIGQSAPLQSLDQVFSIEPRPFSQDIPAALPTSEQWNVVASDATQDAAVALARASRSFIIQGPPGTGKSQTITNLIADYAGQGKRVLFVCEKRAALDVVFHRLGQAGLDGLACIIHDSQDDKKAFIADLKQHYEAWGKSGDDYDVRHRARDRTVKALDQHMNAIASYDAAVGSVVGGMSIRDLVRRAATLPPCPDGIGPQVRERLPDLPCFDAHLSMAQRTARAIADLTGKASLAAHPFARINQGTITGQHPYTKVASMIETSEAALQQLDDWLDSGSSRAIGSTTLSGAIAQTDLAERLVKTNLAGCLKLLDPASKETGEFQADVSRLSELKKASQAANEAASHWQNPLSVSDTLAALELAQSKEKSFFRFLSGPWRSLKAAVTERYDFSKHAVTPTITSLLEKLSAKHQAEADYYAARDTLGRRLGSNDLAGLFALRTELMNGQPLHPACSAMLQLAQNSSNPLQFLEGEARQHLALQNLESALGGVIDQVAPLTMDQISEYLRDLREELEYLPDLLPSLIDMHRGDPRVAFALRSLKLSLHEIEALITEETITRIERERPEIRRFDLERLILAARRSGSAREKLRDENASAIKATLHRQFREHAKVSEQSVAQLDPAGRAFKKAYATGRRELEHEFGKTMRYRSIRDLASGDPGTVVNDLKPIWLMSPLSVSDTLPLRSDLFDVVIFDEASQIPTEEAVPALCRSGQVIIVGDTMQLPPTSFFSTSLDEDDMMVTADEDGETIAIILDADSLLNQASRNLPATLLAWHYRSRSEALISFSNAAFYGGQLVTIPDCSLRASGAVQEAIPSHDESQWAAGVSRLLSMPISTHRLSDGLYENRINSPEANYIAALVRELLLRQTGQSIGIVAFSEAQQSEIEVALERLANQDDDFAAALEREMVREDDGQFNGLFVKNLENVQGDERDIILMSVCYAPGRDKRMVMNFGPINQRGGEKRLNVIFSRARRHMAIITTIAPEAITNVHNDGARALRSFLSFAQAQSNGAHEHAQAVLSTLNPDSAKAFGVHLPHDPVRVAIAQALRERGHSVHEHVGGASFRCDLAILNQAGDGYSLAILLDHTSKTDTSVEERFVFRPSILRAFGWRVLDLPVAGWLRAKDETIARIERELEVSSWDQVDSDPYAGISEEPARPVLALEPHPALGSILLDTPLPTQSPLAPIAGGQPKMTEFTFVEGASAKFWRVGTSENDLIVEYGRIGTKGQRMVKTFESPERAKREATKLTLEKTNKGYQET